MVIILIIIIFIISLLLRLSLQFLRSEKLFRVPGLLLLLLILVLINIVNFHKVGGFGNLISIYLMIGDLETFTR